MFEQVVITSILCITVFECVDMFCVTPMITRGHTQKRKITRRMNKRKTKSLSFLLYFINFLHLLNSTSGGQMSISPPALVSLIFVPSCVPGVNSSLHLRSRPPTHWVVQQETCVSQRHVNKNTYLLRFTEVLIKCTQRWSKQL